MSQTQIKEIMRIYRELQIALMRLALAFDNILDIQESNDENLKLVSLRLTRKLLEDTRDNVENAISIVEELTTELFK